MRHLGLPPRFRRSTCGVKGRRVSKHRTAGQNGAGQIQSQTTPQGSIGYAYDALGRVSRLTVNGKTDRWTYDALGRITWETNSLGTWQTSYLGQTDQPVQTGQPARAVWQGSASILVPPALSLTYAYEDNANDRRLKRLTYQQSANSSGNGCGSIGSCIGTGVLTGPAGSNIRQFDYQTDALGRLSSSREVMNMGLGQVGTMALAAAQYNYGYDQADRLIEVQGTTGQESYRLDPASNLINQSIDASGRDVWNWQGQPNVNNQLAKMQQGFAGYSPEQFTPIYDADGQLTEDANNRYQWDAAGNLTTITNKSTGHVTSMTYDGLNRRVRIEERDGTNSTVTNYLWCGSQICQKLDASNNIIAEYFDQGEEHDDTGTILLYQKDQLGSIRGTVAPNSTQQGSATYTAYGQADRSSGVQADKGYAGMFLHQPSGLYLTWYRAYDPVTSRWLSRDPIEERGGINLYGYVLQNRVNGIDPQGLVNWNGSIYSIEYSVAIGVSTGVGLSKSGFSMSNISFSDNLNYLDPSVFNGKF